MDLLLEHLKKGMILALVLSMPSVLTAAGIGLVVGILQAVTQVQEQTIAAAPKIVMVFVTLILGGGLMLQLMETYVRESAQIAFEDIPTAGDARVMPPLRASKKPANKLSFVYQPQKNHRPFILITAV